LNRKSKIKTLGLFLFCRQGYEKDCAAEIQQVARNLRIPAYCKTIENSAYVQFICTDPNYDAAVLFEQVQFDQLIFTRQWFAITSELAELSDNNRLFDIEANVHSLNIKYSDVLWEVPDTDELKPLNRLTKSLNQISSKSNSFNFSDKHESNNVLHICFIGSTHCLIGFSPSNCTHPNSAGIMHLKLPHQAPSRSMLKLDEALRTFYPRRKQNQILKKGMCAVDLGAAPGGWTWLLTQYGVQVVAIDNGALETTLNESKLVTHIKTDAYKYSPEFPVDWLVADIADKPSRVFELIELWLENNWARNLIFILKLPMLQRFKFLNEHIINRLKEISQQEPNRRLCMKQLSHDRNEITIALLKT